MGTIASVLQWTCTNCNVINPTECLKCLNCGNIRRIRVDRVADYEDSNEDSTNELQKHAIGRIQTTKSSVGKHSTDDNNVNYNQCNSNDNHNGDTITFDDKATNSKHLFHEIRPGYVEVNSNGYILSTCIFIVFIYFSYVYVDSKVSILIIKANQNSRKSI